MNEPISVRSFLLPWLGMTLVIGLGVFMFSLFFGLTKKLSLDSEDVFSQLALLESERCRTTELLQRDRAFLENIEGKKQVIIGVINGRLSLQEAAAQFQSLNLLCPEYDWEGFHRAFPGRTDEECHCRQVLSCLKIEVGNRSGPAYELVARLQAEFDRDTVRS